MTEYELDKMCEKMADCNCDCVNCPLFAKYMESQKY